MTKHRTAFRNLAMATIVDLRNEVFSDGVASVAITKITEVSQ